MSRLRTSSRPLQRRWNLLQTLFYMIVGLCIATRKIVMRRDSRGFVALATRRRPWRRQRQPSRRRRPTSPAAPVNPGGSVRCYWKWLLHLGRGQCIKNVAAPPATMCLRRRRLAQPPARARARQPPASSLLSDCCRTYSSMVLTLLYFDSTHEANEKAAVYAAAKDFKRTQ